MNLSQCKVGQRISALVAENIRREHQRHIISVHFVLVRIVNKAPHKVNRNHEGVPIELVHLFNLL